MTFYGNTTGSIDVGSWVGLANRANQIELSCVVVNDGTPMLSSCVSECGDRLLSFNRPHDAAVYPFQIQLRRLSGSLDLLSG